MNIMFASDLFFSTSDKWFQDVIINKPYQNLAAIKGSTFGNLNWLIERNIYFPLYS